MTDDRPTLLIDDLPEDERPRERLLQKGVRALSDAELLAVLLGSGRTGVSAIDLAQQILQDLDGFSGIHREDISRLLEIKGVGEAKAARIKAAVEVGYRLTSAERGKSGSSKPHRIWWKCLGTTCAAAIRRSFGWSG